MLKQSLIPNTQLSYPGILISVFKVLYIIVLYIRVTDRS